ncbi:uncharacterized protein LOC129789276 [Lutzomyia longipalpis]|uniref:uncharacterized protein LOC129789276 n=1 Tax=Lutzomyia longipalpis TaxID=7200 RepID=UPI0024845DB8|nr:uncharacterized protein LOC129789276 [Lutzomyia longipalpis]
MQKCKNLIFWGLLCLQVSDIVSEDWLPPIDFCAYLLPGLHPSPRSCNDFIMCTESGVPMRGTCGDSYHFKAISPGVGVCTYPEESGCDLSGRECKPEDFWEERVPMTCNQYVRCFHGEITIRQCEKTLHWDSVRQQCTFNFLSDCPYIVCSEDAFPGYNEVIPHPTDCSASEEIPENVAKLLSLGPKFALPTPKVSVFHMIADVQMIVEDIEDGDKRDGIRARLVNIIQNGLTTPKTPSPVEKQIKNWMKETSAFIKEKGKNLVITSADKGNKTVIMDRVEYDQKMAVLVGDTDTYEKIGSDPTEKYSRKNNSLVRVMLEEKVIDFIDKKRMTKYNGIAPRIYGLPKIHKSGVPLRPVVSYVGSPTYHLARFVSSVLSPLSICTMNIRNSMEICQFINEFRLEEHHVLLSLDVVSLFTNVPVDLALTEVERRYAEVATPGGISVRRLVEAAQLCLSTGYFTYKGEMYVQKEGLAMGSPISPIMADLVMQKAINWALESAQLRIQFIKKYVDDLLLAVHEEDVDRVLQVFNAFHPKIQYTMERESQGTIPYLDFTIHRREDGVMRTVWYSKSCASNRMLNYHSGHAPHVVMNVARNFIKRVQALTTKPDTDIERRIHDILHLNDFPTRVVRQLMCPTNMRSSEIARVQRDPPIYFHTITYIPGVSERIKKIVVREAGLDVAFAVAGRNGSFFTKVKDPVPMGQKSGVIYWIPCGGCNLSYVGVTSQHLRARVDQHRRDCRSQVRREGSTALCAHSGENGHDFKFDEVEIVDMHRHPGKLAILEMLHIRKNRHKLVNKRSDTLGLSSVYTNLINMHNDRRAVTANTASDDDDV